MKRPKPQKGFGAIFDKDGLHVPTWTIASSASDVRQSVGRSWSPIDPVNGWKAAKEDGVRVVKVEIRIVR